MVGVDGGCAARPRREEHGAVVLRHQQLHRKPARRRRERRARKIARRVELSLGLRPDHRVHVRLDDSSGVGLEHNLDFVAGDDPMVPFCPNNAKIWYSLSTNVITSLNGIPATKNRDAASR